MNSAKTLLVVGLLAVVGAGAFIVLNKKEPPPPEPDALGWETHNPSVDPSQFQTASPTFGGSTGEVKSGPPGGEAPAFNPGGSNPLLAPGAPRNGPPGGYPPSLGAPPSIAAPGASGSHSSGSAKPDFNPPRFGTDGGPGRQLAPGPPVAQQIPGEQPSTDPRQARSIPDALRWPYDTHSGQLPGGQVASPLDAARQKAQSMIAGGQLDEALQLLSTYYDDPQLTSAQQQELLDLLDRLAGTVLYSREHLLMQPHVVRPGERLETIARQYQVPEGLLRKINGVADPNRLEPGRQLKVVRGPFHAAIDLNKSELTLLVGRRYGGRFPLQVRADVPPGTYAVVSKTNLDTPALDLAARDGSATIRLCGPSTSASGVGNCLILGKEDIEDIYDILLVDAQVQIRR